MSDGGGATAVTPAAAGGPLAPQPVLRVESGLIAAGAVGAYVLRDASLLLFVAVVLLPDLSIAAYLLSARVGAPAYNAVHTYAGPVALLAAGVALPAPLAVDVGLIWAAHVGVDRLFGLGLKYAGRDFSDTHLQQL